MDNQMTAIAVGPIKQQDRYHFKAFDLLRMENTRVVN
jgi:hypothetical protein